MADIQTVSRTRHGGVRWLASSGYQFASTTAIAPLAAAELSKAALAMPVAFVEQDGGWTLAAVLGLSPAQNLYVDPDGTWNATYTPAIFRAYPFRMGVTESSETVLCVDESSGLLSDGSEGTPFFDDDGQPSAALKQVGNFLTQTAQSAAALAQVCNLLHQAGVIRPWRIVTQERETERQVTGLFRIDEPAFNSLDEAAFLSLRRAGAVSVAYAQMLSTGNLADLGRRAQIRAQTEAAERARAEVKPMIMLPEDNTIDWDWSKVGR